MAGIDGFFAVFKDASACLDDVFAEFVLPLHFFAHVLEGFFVKHEMKIPSRFINVVHQNIYISTSERI